MSRAIVFLFTAVMLIASQSADAQTEPSDGHENGGWASSAKTTFSPTINNANIKSVSLFAQNPDIVTPIGIAVAPDGRVFVQENHTHKRNSSYRGPAADRILVFEDTDNDGVADERSVFYEGHTFSTDLLFSPDGHLYVSTRWFIGRFLNAATAKKAVGEPEKLVVCETQGDYPHNGVGGLAIDPANPGWLAFGFGENLGVDYAFVGSDGTRLTGGAEGGSTYICRTDGSGLVRQSTGHWNAFGMAFDLEGNLFSTDNDPNSTPPNRLLHVVPGADFGYEYRYGRSGRHPLVCWYGENPGTLGMIGALGEAACGLVPHGPSRLLSASWTDNRVDLHQLVSKGESFVATREPFLSGPDDFRPVHFAYSADGRYLYFTDWVKLSYPVHGHGRIWRVEFHQPIQLTPKGNRSLATDLSQAEAIQRLGDIDPYVRSRAIYSLRNSSDFLSGYDWKGIKEPLARANYAVAMKKAGATENATIIPELLRDPAPAVRYVAIKWIADFKLRQFQSNLEELLDRADLNRMDLRAALAALATLAGDLKGEFAPDAKLLELARDTTKPTSVRVVALQNIKTGYQPLTVEVLASLAAEESELLKLEAIRSLVIHSDDSRYSVLVNIAKDVGLAADIRAEAIAGLSTDAKQQQAMLVTLLDSKSAAIKSEAERSLVAAGLIQRSLGPKPPLTDLAAWKKLVDEAQGEANPSVGRRLFFHSALGGCYKCHAMNGRGQAIGPDLTLIRRQPEIDSDWLLKHIVNPNAEMAPYYRPQQLLTADGQLKTGLVIGQEGSRQAYVGSDGEIFFVAKESIEERRELSSSIMPTGLLDKLSAGEIRDLIAYLLEGE